MPSALHTRFQENLRLALTNFKEKALYNAKDWVTGAYAADINQDGDIEIVASSREGRVYALSKEGSKRWERIVGDKSSIMALVACHTSSDQPVACVIGTRSGKIYALDKLGKEITPPGSASSVPSYWYDVKLPIVQARMSTAQPLTVVFAAEDCCIYALDLAQNQLRWRFQADAQIRALFTADINGDGLPETLVGFDNQRFSILSSTGKLLSSGEVDQAICAIYATDIDLDGQIEILVSTRTKMFFALDQEFKPKWSFPLSSRALAISIADVNRDQRPEILIACDDQSLSILDNTGKRLWRQKLNKRYQSLSTFDLDFDGYEEILAGSDNAQVYVVRIQLSKDLDKKILHDYSALGKPEISTLSELTDEQLDVLQGLLDVNYNTLDKSVNLAIAEEQLVQGHLEDALLTLVKLGRQRFQFLWAKEQTGYQRVLCLTNATANKPKEMVVGSQGGGLSIFNTRKRQRWSKESIDGGQIFDAQSGVFSTRQGEQLIGISTSGALYIINHKKDHLPVPLKLPDPATCFYLLSSANLNTSELVIGSEKGSVYLYTDTFETPTRKLDLPTAIQQIYASEPDESGAYRNPELLISTGDNRLFAYTRGGNCLWTYPTRSKILALCARDLDSDGHLEILIGSEDRNIYVLDDAGKLLWRYVLYDSVLALETVDVDQDGKLEILAGCADGYLYVFTPVGDMIWRYFAGDRIQALRAADIDLDGNVEIAIVKENCLEVLQIPNRERYNKLLSDCWGQVLNESKALDALYPLIIGNSPNLRAAALGKLAELEPRAQQTLHQLSEAMKDPFIDVRKALPEALIRAYLSEPTRTRQLLTNLFTDWARDVRIEVVEHLELLAKDDWGATIAILKSVIQPEEKEQAMRDRNTRRAVLRKISHLLKDFAPQLQDARETQAEELFLLLQIASLDTDSTRIRQEAGRVLGDFLNLFEKAFLPYLDRLFANQLDSEPLERVSYNLASPTLRAVVANLLKLKFATSQTEILETLPEVIQSLGLIVNKNYDYSTGLWLIYREFQTLFNLSNIKELASYEFSLKPEHFQTGDKPYPHASLFLECGKELETIIRPLKVYVRSNDPTDRLNRLLSSIDALKNFQGLVDEKYGVTSPLPGVQPFLPEFAVFNVLIASWQEMFSIQRNELRGHAELAYELLPGTPYKEETVALLLHITNRGRAPARRVQITLLPDESFATSPQTQLTFTMDFILAGQETTIECTLKPLQDSVMVAFEIVYDDSEKDVHTSHREQLTLIRWDRPFTPLKNPYMPGTPIQDKSMFYGRERDLTYLLDSFAREEAQSVLVLYGQRRTGKTTLLNMLANTDQLAGHVAVKIDLQNLLINLTINKFFFRCAKTISDKLLEKGLPTPIPQRSDFFDSSVDSQEAFEAFLDDVQKTLGKRRLILLFDEFEELEEKVKEGILPPDIFKYLRSLVQAKQDFHFLFSGTHRINEMTRQYWAVFFNIAQHYRLTSRISNEGAEKLITEPVTNLEYDPLAVKKIRLLTADQPYLINLICQALVAHCSISQKNHVAINDVNMVLDSVLETGAVHFDWLWDEKLETRDRQFLLLIIAEGCQDEGRQLELDDIRALYEKYGLPYHQDHVRLNLKLLADEDIIEKTRVEGRESTIENDRYSLPNGLLRDWLRRTRSLKTFLPPPEFPRQAGESDLMNPPKASQPQKDSSSAPTEVSSQNGSYSEVKAIARYRSPEI